ncbi:phosphotransferase enzyme family protein [Aquabacter cavernae]|uniref:phosphotransferase enzyme family protein n=1 Tax=Aquabacter cavernae TaxID=2496029 RepID=UPI000F8EF59B|nr:phosphotransferase [Aquabacter cavernae]
MLDEGFVQAAESALRADLPRWGLAPDARLECLSVSENVAFRAEDGTRDLVLRVHRPGYHDRAEIASELAWLRALEGELPVPCPVAARDGDFIQDLTPGGRLHHVVAFRYLPGAAPEPGADLSGWFADLGALTARLHGHARSWRRPEGFRRKVWTFETTLGTAPHWGDWRAGLGLEADGARVIGRAAARLERDLAVIGQGPDVFGLIHADLRLANLLVDTAGLSLIDFDDCGFSWFLYDFAAAVSFIEHEPYVPALAAAWADGYRRVAPLSQADAGLLPLFVTLRRILLTAWLASHKETDTARALGPDYTRGTVELCEAFLAR